MGTHEPLQKLPAKIAKKTQGQVVAKQPMLAQGAPFGALDTAYQAFAPAPSTSIDEAQLKDILKTSINGVRYSEKDVYELIVSSFPYLAQFLAKGKIFESKGVPLPSDDKNVEKVARMRIMGSLAPPMTIPDVEHVQDQKPNGKIIDQYNVLINVVDPFNIPNNKLPVSVSKMAKAYIERNPSGPLPSQAEADKFVKAELVKHVATPVAHEMLHGLMILKTQVTGFSSVNDPFSVPPEVANAFIFSGVRIAGHRDPKLMDELFDAIVAQGSLTPETTELPQACKSKILQVIAHERFAFDLAEGKILGTKVSNKEIAERYAKTVVRIASQYLPNLIGEDPSSKVKDKLLALMEASYP